MKSCFSNLIIFKIIYQNNTLFKLCKNARNRNYGILGYVYKISLRLTRQQALNWKE